MHGAQLYVRKILFVFCVLGLPFAGLAQGKIIKGYIKDALSNERVPFASINFILSNEGKLSDSAGNFIFHLREWPTDTIFVSYVGYQDYKLFISPDLLKRAVGNQLDLVIGMERGKTVAAAIVQRKIDRGYLMWK